MKCALRATHTHTTLAHWSRNAQQQQHYRFRFHFIFSGYALAHLRSVAAEATAGDAVRLLHARCLARAGGEARRKQAMTISTDLLRGGTVKGGKAYNDLMVVRAHCFYRDENFAQANKHLSVVLRSDPDNAAAGRELKKIRKLERAKAAGNAAFKGRQWQKAVDKYTECLAIDPEFKSYCAKLHCNRAAARRQLKDPAGARDDCDAAIKLDDGYAKAYVRRAAALRELGGKDNVELALRDYEKAKQLLGRAGARELDGDIRATKRELKAAKRKDYYKILNVNKGAGDVAIKKAYKRAAMKWHPDRHACKGEAEKKQAEDMFKDVGEAMGVLSDAKKRRMYDEGYSLEEIEQGGRMGGGGGGMGGIDPNQLFSMFFGGGGGMGGMGGMGGGRRRGRGGGGFHFG